jgi:ribosomal protein S27E
MPLKATCRCGHELPVPRDGSDRVVCSKCGSKVRLKINGAGGEDGFIRFYCPCGRRLKVSSAHPPTHGKCPECGRIVPVPMVGTGRVEARTEDLRAEELAHLEQWASEHQTKGSRVPREVGPSVDPDATPFVQRGPASLLAEPAAPKTEAGIRLCPSCRRPVHLGADSCRNCGASVPRR